MNRQEASGRLELTWANKDRALLTNDDGTYTWVTPSDRRVREIRLLRDAGDVGTLDASGERAKDNLLIRGDSLHALRSLIELPEFRPEFVGKVKLVYIDPPFNTGQAFSQYDDGLEHSTWLSMMRDRLVLIKQLLAPDGSLWVHLDDAEMAYCRVLLDEVFGRENFVATVVWERQYGQSNVAAISISHDYLVVFAKTRAAFLSTRNRLSRTAQQNAAYKNPDNDSRGPWKPGGLDARNYYSRGRYPITTPSGRVIPGPPGASYWRISEEKLRELDEDGRIWWGKDGNSVPSIKRFLSEVQDVAPKTWWSHEQVGHTDEAKKEIRRLVPHLEPFATPKPERLLERILQIATNPDEIVLDCFAGSGTTAAVAHKMGRRWVAVEMERETVEQFMAPRLEKVVAGADDGGISKAVGWAGGGGFRVLDVAPSMYDEDAGTVIVADWASGGELAEATAAQVGFPYEPEGPFCGRRGRTRLAVIDGHVSEDVVRALVGALPAKERLALYAVGLDPAAATLLEKLRPGSKARTIPQDLLASYRSASAWRVELARSQAVETQLTLDEITATADDAADESEA